jgi:hypothetical protein
MHIKPCFVFFLLLLGNQEFHEEILIFYLG